MGSNPTGVKENFPLSPCGFISILGQFRIAQKASFGIFIQHLNLPYSNHYMYMCLVVLSGKTRGREMLLVTHSVSRTCSFAANYHLDFLRPAPSWPCSSVGRATVICSGDHVFLYSTLTYHV